MVRHSIDLNGNNLLVDSFDSQDPAHSYFGQYQASTALDGGDVITDESITNSLAIGNVSICGHVCLGTNGSVALGALGGIGEHTWQAVHPGQVEPGWLTNLANFTLPMIGLPYLDDHGQPPSGPQAFVTTTYNITSTNITTNNYPTSPPWSGVTTNAGPTNTVTGYPGPQWGLTTNWASMKSRAWPAPGTYLDPPGIVTNGPYYFYTGISSYAYPTVLYTYAVYSTNAVSLTNTYDQVLPSAGDYYMEYVSGKTLVLGSNVRLVAGNGVHMNGSDVLVIAPGASLQLYAGGISSFVGGDGIINQSGCASNLSIVCAFPTRSVTLTGNNPFVGTLAAPTARVVLGGAANGTNTFIGALTADSLTLGANWSLHYDAALWQCPALFLAQPQSQSARRGASVTFTYNAPCGYCPIWAFNGNPIPGATNSFLTISNVCSADAGTYCVYLEMWPGVWFASSNATLTVLGDPPSIAGQPVSQAALAGSSVVLRVAAAGTEPLAYQWKLNGADMPGATDSALALASVQPGTYTVVVTNTYGSATSSEAVLSLTTAPDFLWARASAGIAFTDQGAGPASSGACGLATDPAGNVLLAGWSSAATLDLGGVVLNNSGSGPMEFICKYDAGGNVLWGRSAATAVSGALPQRIGTDAQGNAYLASRFQGTATFGTNTLVSAGPGDLFVAKYDPQGQPLWARRIGGYPSNYYGLFGFAVDAAGNAFVAARYSGTADFGTTSLTNGTAFLAKYDPTGTLVWATQALAVEAIAADASGAVFATGLAGILARYDPLGNLAWSRPFPCGQAIAVDAHDNLFVTGYGVGTYDGLTITNSGGSGDLFVARCASTGQLLWLRQSGGIQQERGFDLALDSFDNIYVTGGSASANPEPRLVFGTTVLTNVLKFVAKYDSAGNALWAAAPVTDGWTSVLQIAVADPADIYVAGAFGSAASFGSFTLRNDDYFQYLATELFLARLAGLGLETTGSPVSALGAPLSSASGRFQFNLTGAPGLSYVVEGSTNLIDWEALTTNTPPFIFADPSAPTCPQRFYRAVCRPTGSP
jgi:hypothetical protein